MRIVVCTWLAVSLVLSEAGFACAQSVFGPGAIVARIRDASDRPLPGALVEAVGAGTYSATTNAGGVATLVGLPAGAYDVSVSLSGYETFSERVLVTSITSAPQVVTPTLQVSSLESPGTALTARALPALGASLDPFVSHALAADAATNVVSGGGAPGISLDGTLPYESRVELDGIPIAGGSTSVAAVRFRNAIGLSGVDVLNGPYVDSPDVRDAVGGVVDYRTPSLDGVQTLGIDSGYDSALGNFEHARAVRDFGKLAIAADVVTGNDGDRTQTLEARYAPSTDSSIDVATYDLQGSGPIGVSDVSASAPAFSSALRFALGGGTFEARSFKSALREYASVQTPAAQTVDASLDGVQLGYGLPLGADHVSFGFDRRTEDTAIASAAAVKQTFTSFSVRSEFALAQALKLDLADVYSGGTLVRARNDPQAALTYRIGTKTTLRIEAGSSFATAPDDVLAGRDASSPALLPETAFGYRFRAIAKVDASDSLDLTAYDERRFDTFAALPDADSRGVGLGLEHAPARGFGARAYVALDRTSASGTSQPLARNAEALDLAPGEQLVEEPYAKARLGLTYRTSPLCEDRFGTTFLGANNGLSTAGVAIGDVSVCLPLFGLVDVHAGEQNLFGASVSDPVLAPLYVPHEFTFSLGLH